MAIRADTGTDGLVRTTNLLDYNAAYTVTFWFNLDTSSGTFTFIFGSNDNSFNNYDYLGFDTGVRLYLEQAGGATGGSGTGSSVTAGQWNHGALVRTLTSLTFYLNGVSNIALTGLSLVGRAANTRNEFLAMTTVN